MYRATKVLFDTKGEPITEKRLDVTRKRIQGHLDKENSTDKFELVLVGDTAEIVYSGVVK
jgi:hypothetical protein